MIWHKVCWPSSRSPSGFATHGGLVRQIETLSGIFDATRVVGPCSRSGDRPGERPLAGKSLSVVSLTSLPNPSWLAWLTLPFWLVRNGFTLTREISRADAVFALLPPIGILGQLLALALRKPLLTRPMNWSNPRLPWRLERALLERVAGGRNVVFATGSSDEPPSRRNPAIRWIFSTTVSEAELRATTIPRSLASGSARLIIVGRELETDGTRLVLHALPLLADEFPRLMLHVVGHGAALSKLRRLAGELQLLDRVTFHGAEAHERVFELLRQADLFCLPTAETESVRQAVHEALACGLPVVTARTSLAPMLIGCGVILPNLTAEALAMAVRACLSDPAGYRRMSAQALRAAQAYSLERWRDTVGAALQEAWGPLSSEGTLANTGEAENDADSSRAGLG